MSFKSIWEYIKEHINFKTVLLIISLGLCIFLIIQNSYLKRVYSNKVRIATDSLEVYKNRVGELYVSQQTYVTTVKDLERLNDELYKEVKKLKDNPLIVTKIVTEFQHDTLIIPSNEIVYKDTVYMYTWNYNDEWCSIEGNSEFNLTNLNGTTTINKWNSITDLTLDIVEDKNKELQILIKSSNPYCTIKSIEGAVISPDKIKSINSNIKNKNKWGLGFQLGGGIGLYNNGYKNIPVVVPYVGIGLSYNLITF